jgi:hypothetical protein
MKTIYQYFSLSLLLLVWLVRDMAVNSRFLLFRDQSGEVLIVLLLLFGISWVITSALELSLWMKNSLNKLFFIFSVVVSVLLIGTLLINRSIEILFTSFSTWIAIGVSIKVLLSIFIFRMNKET